MDFFESLKRTSKGIEDYRRDLANIVRTLPGVQDILNKGRIDIEDFAIEENGTKFTCEYGVDSLTIYVEDSQCRLVYEGTGKTGKQEQLYDRNSGIETLRILEEPDIKYIFRRDETCLEKVYATRDIAGKKFEDVRDIAAPLGSISKGAEFDIATLSACGDKLLHRFSGRYLDCKIFTERNIDNVKKAVRKSKYPDKCCKYDKTVEEILGRTQ